MGYFKDLRFGKDKDGKSNVKFGMFDNSKIPAGEMLKLLEGEFRTEGVFAPGLKDGQDRKDANLSPVQTPKAPEDWKPVILLKALEMKSKSGLSKRYEPGFLPPAIMSKQIVDKKLGKGKVNEYSWNEDNAWIGHLLNTHLDSDYYNAFKDNFKSVETKSKLEESTTARTVDDAYSARDYYLRFNDQGTDYFRHNLHIDGYTNLRGGRDERESWTGRTSDESLSTDNFRLASFKNTPYENNDPVVYGFEMVIDSVSSPLLNGSVEEFIAQFSYISEIASKAIVIDDFKRQLTKIFKTRGTIKEVDSSKYDPDAILINKQRTGQTMISNSKGLLAEYANAQTPGHLYRAGKKAYMSYYLQKVDGLSKLIESNTPDAKKYLVDYGKDVIKLTFLEDVSATMGALAHLYKLLYWSKPNGKNLIPENLLRFNCDIIVSECRNFNRVRKAANTSGDLEIIKDNVSRYIYSLKECQFYFNTMPHEDSIDMGNVKAYGEGQGAFEVIFDYKYSTSKFEKWVPDLQNFGQYVGYNSGAIWKIGNKNMGRKNAIVDGGFITMDTSIPKFYTVGTNTTRNNGVTSTIIFDQIGIKKFWDDEKVEIGTLPTKSATDVIKGMTTVSATIEKPGDSVGEDEEAKDAKKEQRKKKRKEGLDKFKETSKKVAVNIAKGAAKFVFNEVNNQINMRARMLEDTINKTRDLLGLGGLKTEPKRVYPRPYSPHSFGIFFDVRNDLFNFLGEEVAGIVGGAMQTLLPGTQLSVPFKMPNVGATLAKLTKGFSLYDVEAKIIGKMSSKGPKMPFFDESKHSTKWAGSSINKIYNSTTTFKYPMTTENAKFGGGAGVLALSYMKPKGNIFSDGNTNPAKMLDKYSKPGKASGKGAQRTYIPIGTKDFNQIGFGVTKGGDHQKYPAPVIMRGKETIYGDVDGNTAGKSKSSVLLNLYSNPSVTSFSAEGVTFKPIGTKDFSKVGFGMGLSDHQKYPDPNFGQGKIYGDVGGNTAGLQQKDATMLNLYSKPSIATWGAGGVTFKPIGTKDFSKIGFGIGEMDHQKYPAPIYSSTFDLESVVKAGTKWSYPVNDKKFGK